MTFLRFALALVLAYIAASAWQAADTVTADEDHPAVLSAVLVIVMALVGALALVLVCAGAAPWFRG